jgi:hypothetical protein
LEAQLALPEQLLLPYWLMLEQNPKLVQIHRHRRHQPVPE